MFIQYQYLSINKNENGLKQMSLKNMHQYTKLLQFFEMFTGNMIPNPHGTIVLFFVWRFTCFENNEDKIINK